MPRAVDIDSLSYEELVELNHRIVARLRFLQQMRSHAEMLDFTIGEKVAFQPPGRPQVVGMLTRYNKKTVTVITESGEHWNVAPGLLFKVANGAGTEGGNQDQNVLPLRPRLPQK